ncbi:unnamed protein product [Rhizoctonia solani]|uniref:F-box domain-containing protein n=1 Tax=Rhizoctonia solani TaxID=456999 RepID=A0A8H3AU98_9AGAM|nr:unnamed protein product [Rhizoctonia solani]
MASIQHATAYDTEHPRSYIQFTTPAVCRHWRKVALDTISLWTTIRHVKFASLKRTELYLTRSGPTVPLDIKIWLIGPKVPKEEGNLEQLEIYAKRIQEILASIVKNGGSVSKWKSLSFRTDIFASCVAIMDFLRPRRFPSLESLEFIFAGPWLNHPDDERMLVETYSNLTTPKLLFTKSPPQLRSIKMEGVMSLHLFGDISRPQFVGLTDIYISFVGFHPDVDHIYSMLEASPRLARLCFNSEGVDLGLDTIEDRVIPRMRSQPQVVLSSLVSLGFIHIVNPVWTISVLKTFRAPVLQKLILSFWDDPDGSQLLVDYISNQGTGSSPYFPTTINELSFFTMTGEKPDPESLLRAYPNIDAFYTGSLAALLKRPWLLPNLRFLSAAIQDVAELKNVVVGRCRDGLPLNEVELRWFGDGPLPSEDEEQIGKLVNLTVRTLSLTGEEDDSDSDGAGEEQS